MVLLEPPKRLGELLMNRGLLDLGDLNDALTEQNRSEELLGQVLLKMGLLRDEDLMFALADQRKLQSSSDAGYSTHRFTLRNCPVRLLIEYQAAAVTGMAKGGCALKILATLESNELSTPELEPLLIPGGDGATLFTINEMLFHSGNFLHQHGSGPVDHGEERFQLILSRLLFLTLHRDATALKIMPDDSGWKIVIQRDTTALDIAFIHRDRLYLQAGVLAAAKIWGGLDPGLANQPQTGGMQIEYLGQPYDFEIQTQISPRGELLELTRSIAPAE